MFIAAHEWSQPRANTSESGSRLASVPAAQNPGASAALYRRLAANRPDKAVRLQAAGFLRSQIARLDSWRCELPDSAQDLEAWMHACAQTATAKYTAYLEERKAGAPRRFFSNRAHALYFLRAVAPTKLVDGAWLYGLVSHWENPRFSNLVRTYVEELGEGAADKNHVVLYRRLLARYGLDMAEDLDDSLYTQGLIQLSLAFHAEEFLPELIGFNLGYEQLPLHLLITAYELNELGLDPYYFTLHVTVDNTDTGHAKRAVQGLIDNLPRLGKTDEFWRRVRLGFQLSDAGAGTTEVIAGFDIEQEVVRILSRKSVAGHGAHSDYCRVGGRNVNDWLAQPDDVPAFLGALQNAGWIKLGAPVEQSRFWSLLQGDRAEMFGVFNDYELQIIHDWIRGSASADGRAHTEQLTAPEAARLPSFRARTRLAAARGHAPLVNAFDHEMLDSDLQTLTQQLAVRDEAGQAELLIAAMAPSEHWTPAGLHATRVFCARSR